MRSNKRTIMGAAIIGGIMTVILAVFIWQQTMELGEWPNERAPGNLKTRQAASNRRVQDLLLQVASKDQIFLATEIMEREDEVARQILPDRISPDTLIAVIRDVGRISGVTVTNLSGGRGGAVAQDRSNLRRLDFSITISGTYDRIGDFINQLEQYRERSHHSDDDHDENGEREINGEGARRFFEVTNFNLSSEGNGLADRSSHNVSLVLSTYTYTGS